MSSRHAKKIGAGTATEVAVMAILGRSPEGVTASDVAEECRVATCTAREWLSSLRRAGQIARYPDCCSAYCRYFLPRHRAIAEGAIRAAAAEVFRARTERKRLRAALKIDDDGWPIRTANFKPPLHLASIWAVAKEAQR